MKEPRKKFQWSFRIILIILTFLLGLAGYTGYQLDHIGDWTSFHPLYSTLKLFAGGFEASVGENDNPLAWYYFVLTAAKWMALFITGNFILKMIAPYASRLKTSMRYLKWTRNKTQVMLIGNNEENLQILQSAGEDEECLLVCGEKEDTEELTRKHVRWIQNRDTDILGTQIRVFLRSRARHCVIIINTLDDETNLLYASSAIEAVNAYLKENHIEPSDIRKSTDWNTEEQRLEILRQEKRFVEVLDRLRIIAFGDSRYQTIYQNLEARSHGIFRFTNRYQQSAFDFVMDHPMTEYLTGPRASWLDGHGCVQPDVDLQTFLIGFDAFNEQILTVSMATNQFIEASPGCIPRMKSVHYHVFAAQNSLSNKNLNHSAFRYMNEFTEEIRNGTLSEESYFPLPPMPAVIDLHEKSIHDTSFYQEIRELCMKNPKSVNTMFISFGNDMENLDFAQKMSVKKLEWGLSNLSLYIRIQNEELLQEVSGLMDSHAVFFGQNDQVFDLKRILHDRIGNMAYQRHLMYALEDLHRQGNHLVHTRDDASVHAMYEWYTMDPSRRLSNAYGIVSLRMKLQLISLDFVPHVAGSAALCLKSNEDYFSVYAEGDRPELRLSGSAFGLKDLYAYDEILPEEDYARGLIRRNLAIQEHYRWNAYMMTRGFIPATIQDCLDRNQGGHRDWYRLRLHGNLTTFEGLFRYRELLASRTGQSESQADVIKWDYQLMDDAWWFLHENGYDVITR